MYAAPVKMDMKKKIELVVLIIAIFWGILFVINYIRYTDSKAPLLALKIVEEYEDGKVTEYISLGYVYRYYDRVSINREEFVPFWVLKENPEAIPDLPTPHTGYEVPENYSAADKFRGLLYYFDSKYKTVGTYKCINSSMDCNKAFSGHDNYNRENKDYFYAREEPLIMGNIHEKFAFVDDSLAQDGVYGDKNYYRTIYLYQYLEEDPQILAKFADVKASIIDEFFDLGYGENNRFIVKSMDNNKWGLIHISEKGTITEVLPYEYDSISYDIDTKFYILAKNGVWFIYDLENQKTISAESVDPIYDVWRNYNLTYYFKTGRDRTVGQDSFVDYDVYKLDGSKFLVQDKVTAIIPYSKFIMYVTSTDNVLHFIDYGKEEKYRLQLKFWQLDSSKYTNPAFKLVSDKKDIFSFYIYEGRNISYKYDYVFVYTDKWEYNK